MRGAEARWAGIEAAVRQRPGDPDGFRVVFERPGPRGRARLVGVDVDGAADPVVTGFVRPAGADAFGPDRAEFERKAVAVVHHLAQALAAD